MRFEPDNRDVAGLSSDCPVPQKSMSPRWNVGAMDSEITQTIGNEESARTQSAFQAIKVSPSGERTSSRINSRAQALFGDT